MRFGTRRTLLGGGGGAAPLTGGNLLLSGEDAGLGIDFTAGDGLGSVAVKGHTTNLSNVPADSFLTNSGTSPKLVRGEDGVYRWTAHNLFLNSATPATQNVTLITGATYTVTVTGAGGGNITGSSGASGTATTGSPATFVATGTTGTFTLTGSLSTIQINRGSVATANMATVGSARFDVPMEYDDGWYMLREPTATNILLNNATLATQDVTTSAVAYTLSFFGTGSVTLTGTSTAGPLVGTGATDRVSLTFTPTAGTLTLTVAGSVTDAQLELGSVATSPIPTFAATVTRAADNISSAAGSFPVGAANSLLMDIQSIGTPAGGYAVALSDNSDNEIFGFRWGTGFNNFHSGANDASITDAAIDALSSDRVNIAGRSASNDVNAARDGTLGTQDTTSSPAVPTRLFIGNYRASGGIASSSQKVFRIVSVARGWTDEELQTTTAA